MAGGTLYYNTNLGAVAAVAADDGRLLWVSLYPRDRRGDLAKLAPHWRRELNPCVFDRGTLLVAPADSPRIFAFDAATGQALWQTGTEVEDAVDLLGVAGEWLIAGGRKLYWISLRDEDRGRVKHVWPDGAERPGYGRGVLAGDSVLWPTRDNLYIFDQQTAQPRKVVDLARPRRRRRQSVGGRRATADRHGKRVDCDWAARRRSTKRGTDRLLRTERCECARSHAERGNQKLITEISPCLNT